MADEKVKVRIRPLHGIGGVGEAGDVVWMTQADAEMYVKDGFVEYVTPADLTPSPYPDGHTSPKGDGGEDHAIMKPQSKRGRKK